ncbi:hypothetical protein [Aestuariivivens sp. NBU2969]|uniref:SGNH/GDSL hydrolase family protein n=1 Tax=Aestuariivivens sp. NBU2969 TaxID=2873267 RepID=UPI001CBD369E|nr:hypothetical protein [Aestuariivivens sp. NBU2969]
MKNKLLLLLFAVHFISGCTTQTSNLKGEKINENTEWTHTWIVNTNDTLKPKVLLIGDSHVERYYPVVARNLGDSVSCSKFTSSKSLGDPVFIKQLESVLMINEFDIIAFNNGLHGADYNIEQYAGYIPVVYNLLKENAKRSVIWVNTTAIREKNNIEAFADRNKQIIERNSFLKEFTKKNNITLIDFYAATANEPEYYTNDGIHFNNEGVAKEATLLTERVFQILRKEH